MDTTKIFDVELSYWHNGNLSDYAKVEFEFYAIIDLQNNHFEEIIYFDNVLWHYTGNVWDSALISE